jgi:K+-transporting ATPase KdpF subunit
MSAGARGCDMETFVVSGIAAALLGYLFYSLLRPERF